MQEKTMNATIAQGIMNDFKSKHEQQSGYYFADFSIKVYHTDPPSVSITAYQQRQLNKVVDIFETEREDLIEEVESDKTSPYVLITGRSGGWLTCRWEAPESGTDKMRIARAIQRIYRLVTARLDYVKSPYFWDQMVSLYAPYTCPTYMLMRSHELLSLNTGEPVWDVLKNGDRLNQSNTPYEHSFWDAFNMAVRSAAWRGETSIEVQWSY